MTSLPFPSSFLRPISLLAGRLAFVIIAGLASVRADDAPPPIQCHLSYSVDGGKTFTDTPPHVDAAQKIQVRAEWTVSEQQTVKDNVVISSLRSEQTDFASANVGRQTWGPKPAWYQRIDKPYFNIQSEFTTTYVLDLGARPEGQMGTANSWDKDQQKYVDGPLPSCDALNAGVYDFIFSLKYHLASGGPALGVDVPFTVTIGPAGPTAK